MFVKGIGDLQPADEGGGGHVLVAVIYQGHPTLKIINIVLQALPDFHFYCKEVVVVSLEFPPRSKLIKNCLGHLTEIPERISQERIEPVVGDPLEAGWECSTEERSS